MAGIFKVRLCCNKLLYVMSTVLAIVFLYYLHTFYNVGNKNSSKGGVLLKVSIDSEGNSVVGVDRATKTAVSGSDNLLEDLTDSVSIKEDVIQSIRNTDLTSTTSHQDRSKVKTQSNEFEILPDMLIGNTDKIAIGGKEKSVSWMHRHDDVTDSLNSNREEYSNIVTREGNLTQTTPQPHRTNMSTPFIPCNNLKSIPAIESNNDWKNFKELLRKYSEFHREQLERLQRAGEDGENVRTLTYVCNRNRDCSGIGDQFYKIQQVLLLAIAFHRVLILHWDPVSMKTFKHLLPNSINWNYFNVTFGMHLKPDPEISKLKTNEHFQTLMQVLQDKTRTHLTLSYSINVPFRKGLIRLLRADTNRALSMLSLDDILNGKNNVIPFPLIGSELLRFLFTFSQEVLLKVKEAQEQLGIQDVPYLGVHIRTGFWGTDFQEVGHFSKKKIFRTNDAWRMTMDCSTRLADTMLAPKAPVYMATDSYIVKMEAVRNYSPQIRTLNMTLQHVALIKNNKPKKIATLDSVSMYLESNQTHANTTLTGMDGGMATWVDFLLLARADILVHSISGFSTVAGQFCSVKNLFYTPKCSQHP